MLRNRVEVQRNMEGKGEATVEVGSKITSQDTVKKNS